ncbi:MAG: trimethylamine methyltransferase family protein [Candidatus Lokiarchaeota archaeon]|nr:trimethylamine methyltransferase family protein [Candidatus Lokiarchaeota archaeon]
MSIRFQALDEQKVERILDAAKEILEGCGCNVMHPRALKLFRDAGATIEGDRAKIPRKLVERCIESAPKGFWIYDRNGNRAMHLSGKNSYYGTSTASPKTRDPFTGAIRETRIGDIELGARVADALSNIDYVMPMGTAQDVPAAAEELYEFRAVVTNTTKPVVFIGYTPDGVRAVHGMAAAVAGGEEQLHKRPFAISYPEPISPLVFPGDVVEKMLVAAELGMPQVPGSTVQPGTTAPVTLAGAVSQLVAEGLVSLSIVQLANPGAPCFLSGNLNIFDMDTTLMSIAAPEMSLGIAAQAEVARALGLPTWGLAGSTDSKLLDAQAGIESTFSILTQGLAGLNMIHDVGYIDMAMVCSPEMLVLGDEVIGMTRRLLKGIDVNDDTLATATIKAIGPGGNYLKSKHTLANYRSELWFPSLLTRKHANRWLKEGASDMGERIRTKIAEIAASHAVPALPATVIERLDETITSHQRRHVR